MTPFDFDIDIDRRRTRSVKWQWYGEGILPMWVADMDFPAPESVIQALRQRVDHGVFGYESDPADLREVICERLRTAYGWEVVPEALVFLPGVVPGFNLAVRSFVDRALMIQTPVYAPILHAGEAAGVATHSISLLEHTDGFYEIDFNRFAEAANYAQMFLLCNPHNPVGRVFTEAELTRMAEMCLRYNVLICSDEIHCDLIFEGHRHRPIAALSPEIEAQTLTLMAPSKTYNIAGLHCAFAVIPNPDLRKRFEEASRGLLGPVNALGVTAALAAYQKGQPWLAALLCYLQANRDFLWAYVTQHLPGVKLYKPEGTYLAWLDCRDMAIEGSSYKFFLEQAHVALNDGTIFGTEGEQFVRLNFGCPRTTLTHGLERMREALQRTLNAAS